MVGCLSLHGNIFAMKFHSDSASVVSDGFGFSFSHGHGHSRDSGYRGQVFGHAFGERGNIYCFVIYFVGRWSLKSFVCRWSLNSFVDSLVVEIVR